MMMRLRYNGWKWRAMALLVFGRKHAALDLFESMLAELGRRREGLTVLDQLVRISPDNARHWFNYGFMLEHMGEYEQAEAAFRRSTELSPQLDRAWYGLGLVLIRLQRFDEAVVALKKNTKLQPMSPYGWYQLARVHVDRHEPEEARRIIAHLRRFEPKVAAQLERETGIFVPPAS
jgi:Flp pilus assembly protein TadD